jgi:hypothetical protein
VPDVTPRTGPRPAAVPWRVGTTEEWANTYLRLGRGEAGRNLDTGEVRYGDGIHLWADLPSAPTSNGGSDTPVSDDALAAHIADETPHPAYDDIPSVVVLFENGLV